MTQHALIALIQDAETQLYVDPDGAFCFARNLVWGPLEFQAWCENCDAVRSFESECGAGVVIDFDARALLWYSAEGFFDHPRSIEMLDRLIAQAWPGFEILYGEGMSDLQIAAGDSVRHANALRLINRDQQTDTGDELCDAVDPDLGMAWVTVLDKHNTIHQRWIGKITSQLIRHDSAAMQSLINGPAQRIPDERLVHEGMVVDENAMTIHLWGGRDVPMIAREMATSWNAWRVNPVLTGGYALQCKLSGPVGQPMSDAEALGNVLPALLMTESFDSKVILNQIGRSVRGCIGKGVAVLTALVCVPFLIFAVVSGNWKSAGITIALVVAAVFVTFKWIEWSIRLKIRAAQPSEVQGSTDHSTPRSAGPQIMQDRRRHLDQLLLKAGLPSIVQAQPYFPSWFSSIR